MTAHADQLEWLEADGRGGFASGTASGVRTRRYHAWLLSATTPPTGRMVLVSGADVWVEGPFGRVPISAQRYVPDVVHPDGNARLASFSHEPWPSWTYRVAPGLEVQQELFVDRESGATILSWRPRGTVAGSLVLRLRPFLAARDYHGLQHENGAWRFDSETDGARVRLSPYDGVPAINCISNGTYRHAPDWYRRFLYLAEQERGLDAVEDLVSPGEFVIDIAEDTPAILILVTGVELPTGFAGQSPRDAYEQCREREARRRAECADALARASDAYLVTRGDGRTIVAGYPWFTDWGRDTFIAVRGLCLTTGRLDAARDILTEWAKTVSEGMLPNRFPDGGALEFNSVDASLWFVVAVHDYLVSARRAGHAVSQDERRTLRAAVLAIVEGYARGTRYGIHQDADGLLAAGVHGQQLTWMDARVGDREITPRIGKPVEIEALWINALHIAGTFDAAWHDEAGRAERAFAERFWCESRGYLADVVDADHIAGRLDVAFRPNQILAVGGLPFQVLSGQPARMVVDAVETRLLTPVGLRTLDPRSADYAGRYEGDGAARDAVYHQGTVWPWLMAPFVDAWLRVRGNRAAAKREAHERFIVPMSQHLDAAGLGHVSEIADGDAPFTPRGCPFQAWSVGEWLRARQLCNAAPTPTSNRWR